MPRNKGRLPALALAMIAGLGIAAWAEDGASDRSALPRFDSAGKGPVLLRYKFVPGGRTACEVEIDILMEMEASGQKMSIEMPMKMSCYYRVKSVAGNGDATADLVITRTAFSVKSPKGNSSYDSDADDGSDPQFGSLRAMLNVPIPVRISALGKVLAMDTQPMEEAVRRAGTAAMNLGDTTDKIVKSSFIMLPERAVMANDSYEAGEIVQRLENMGEMTSKVRYRVLAVSGDGTRAILQPSGDFSLNPAAQAGLDLKMDSVKFDGWILFDVAGGNILRSYGDIEMSMRISQDGQSMNFFLSTKVFNDQLGK